MRKRRLFVLLLLLCLCLVACGKESAEDKVNSDIGNESVQLTEIPEPTEVPDSEVTKLMLEELFNSGVNSVSSAVNKDTVEPNAVLFFAEAYLPESLTGGVISNIQLQADTYVSTEQELKTAMALHIDNEEALQLELYLDKDLNLYLCSPKYSTECVRLPITITDSAEGTSVDLSGLNEDVFTNIMDTLKKGVIGSLEFEKIESSYTIGKADKCVSGLAYISKLNVAKLQNSLVKAVEELNAAGLPINVTSIDETVQDMKFVYIKNGKDFGVELLNPSGTESIGIVSCSTGVAVYFYDEYDESYMEVFRYDVLGEDRGVFYIYLGDTEFSGDIVLSGNGFEITDLLLGDSGIVIDSVEYADDKLDILYSEEMDKASLTVGVTLGKDAGSMDIQMDNGTEMLTFDAKYIKSEFKDFSIPKGTTEDIEEFLYQVLESSDVLMKYLIGEDYYYEDSELGYEYNLDF